ncbi:hypothetical protein [Methylorubrum sp. DB1722]|uniref:hypothetical protein n=1 Tax=Methylorubrum sp. DB1722 TaxID=2478916 RepID=UPI0018E348C4|nr:hypothetical protein [Methylorubrum sp. DB1722]MBI1690480.1 hypothetical protein [Methylorubrum sp. DB1722]
MTGPVTTEALVESLAHELARLDGWQDPNALWTDNLGIIVRGGAGSPVYLDYVEDAGKLVAGPLAPLLATLQQVTAERDTHKQRASDYLRDIAEDADLWTEFTERLKTAEASLAVATSELARLRAEGEGTAVVPLEPTVGMQEDGLAALEAAIRTHGKPSLPGFAAAHVYRAMVAARPSTAKEDQADA